MQEIRLVRVGDVDSEIISWLLVALADTLKVPCSLEEKVIDPTSAYHAGRQQYYSTQLLGEVWNCGNRDSVKLLGVCDLDLFIPILTFVFGEAQLSNRSALISICRLRQKFYGLPEDSNLLYARCEKEAVHELGHTFGLLHCSSYTCVMHHSNSIEQIDLKSSFFCPACLESLTLTA
jgi:archaemetzincin